MTQASSVEVLTLHAVRLKGVADDQKVARRFGLDQATASEVLLDCQAFGWISWSEFAGTGGWSLTNAGRSENERQLAAELDAAGAASADAVRETYQAFLPLNQRLQSACTNWQLRPTPDDAMAFNDHSDSEWDGRVIDELAALANALGPISNRLTTRLDRFNGYDTRFTAALERVVAGDTAWVDGSTQDSCHTVWFELHEDFIATLGLARG